MSRSPEENLKGHFKDPPQPRLLAPSIINHNHISLMLRPRGRILWLLARILTQFDAVEFTLRSVFLLFGCFTSMFSSPTHGVIPPCRAEV
jgi:hypothetical protein